MISDHLQSHLELQMQHFNHAELQHQSSIGCLQLLLQLLHFQLLNL